MKETDVLISEEMWLELDFYFYFFPLICWFCGVVWVKINLCFWLWGNKLYVWDNSKINITRSYRTVCLTHCFRWIMLDCIWINIWPFWGNNDYKLNNSLSFIQYQVSIACLAVEGRIKQIEIFAYIIWKNVINFTCIQLR